MKKLFNLVAVLAFWLLLVPVSAMADEFDREYFTLSPIHGDVPIRDSCSRDDNGEIARQAIKVLQAMVMAWRGDDQFLITYTDGREIIHLSYKYRKDMWPYSKIEVTDMRKRIIFKVVDTNADGRLDMYVSDIKSPGSRVLAMKYCMALLGGIAYLAAGGDDIMFPMQSFE